MNVAKLPPPSLAQQIEELKREGVMRDQVYPKLIAAKKMRPMTASENRRRLEAAIRTLEALFAAPETLTVGELLRGTRR